MARQTNFILEKAKRHVRYRGPADQEKRCAHLKDPLKQATNMADKLATYAAMKYQGCQRGEKERGGPNK